MTKTAKTPKQKKIKTITVIGRRWFNRGPGNTYHSAEIIVDGEPVEGVHFAYGYGDQYLYNAMLKLEQLGIITNREKQEGTPGEAFWRWAERNKVKLTYSATDVKRKKDL